MPELLEMGFQNKVWRVGAFSRKSHLYFKLDKNIIYSQFVRKTKPHGFDILTSMLKA